MTNRIVGIVADNDAIGSLTGKYLTFLPVGLVVDGVEEVAQVRAGELEKTPDFGPALDTAYILGMAKVRGKGKMLLDIDKVVTADALDLRFPGASDCPLIAFPNPSRSNPVVPFMDF